MPRRAGMNQVAVRRDEGRRTEVILGIPLDPAALFQRSLLM